MASTQVNTYFAKGNREGLTNQVADLFADEVPFFAMAKKESANATKHEWQEDSLASASTTGIIEGASITYAQAATRTRRQNYCHIRSRNWDVTFTQMAVETAGISDAVAREVMKAMKALMLDYDKIFLNTGNSAAGTTSSARTAKGIQKAIVTNTAVGTGTGSSATIQLTEDNVNLVLKKIWAQGGDPRALFCGGHNKMVISKKFSAKTGFTWNVEASARTAIANVNKYEGSFGTLDVIPDRQHRVKRVTIVTPDLVKIAILRDIQQYKGAATASSVKGWVEAEMTLNYGNEKAHGKISYLKSGGTIA
jgi:hypothetical protein